MIACRQKKGERESERVNCSVIQLVVCYSHLSIELTESIGVQIESVSARDPRWGHKESRSRENANEKVAPVCESVSAS